METLTCIYCSTSISLTSNFCRNCTNQIRCKNCKSLLEKDSKCCEECGEILIERTTDPNINSNSFPLNKFSFNQKGDSKAFNAEFSNEVGSTFAAVIAGLVGGSSIKPKLSLKTASSLSDTILTIPASTSSNQDTFDSFSELNEGEETALFQKLFKVEDQKLMIADTRVKHSGKLDQAVRITLLLLYYYKQAGHEHIEKSIIIEELNRCKLVNNHYRSWLTNGEELMTKDSHVCLSVPGEEKASQILLEILNPNIITGSLVFGKVGKSKSKKRKSTNSSPTEEKTNHSSTRSSTTSPTGNILSLIESGFFNEPKKLNEIINYLKEKKVTHYKNTDLQSVLSRLVIKGTLNRDKNKSDNQYEYSSKSTS